MAESIRVLIVEDDSDDAELMVRTLARAGFALQWNRVETEAEYLTLLEQKPDVILSDSNLPQFDGIRALELLRQKGLDIPFLLVSGRVGEDLAVDAMKKGAQDYLLKDRLARLGEAVRRAMEQKRVRAEKAWALEALRQSEERYRLVSEITSDYAYALAVAPDGTLNCEWITPPFTRITGYRAEELELLGWMTQFHAEDVSAMQRHYEGILKPADPGTSALDWMTAASQSRSLEVRILTKDGQTRWVRIYGRSSWSAAEGRVARIYGAAQDITEQKEMEQKYLQAQKMEAVGRLAGGVAHDFNNLLTVIKGYGATLKNNILRNSPGTEQENISNDRGIHDQLEQLDQIADAAERASQLTKQLLAFSRQQVMQPQIIDLNKTLKGLEQLMRPLMGADVEFRAILSPEPALVRADPTQIDQVIMNFVVNACDAMPAGGELTIEIATTELDRDVITKMHADLAPGRFVVLAVSDTGIGMDEATAQHIFEPFFTTKETGKGVGLGLATVHGIIRQSGGSIWVTSEAKVGTTFTVYLPRVMENDEKTEAVGSVDDGRAAVAAVNSETILLVEDDRTLRALIRQVLNTAGYRVLESRDVEEALELCERHEGVIALMVTDVVMPVMSGPQLAERVVKMRPELKVLFSSGYPGAELEEQGLWPEEIHFFEKPFTPDALLRKVREVLDSAS